MCARQSRALAAIFVPRRLSERGAASDWNSTPRAGGVATMAAGGWLPWQPAADAVPPWPPAAPAGAAAAAAATGAATWGPLAEWAPSTLGPPWGGGLHGGIGGGAAPAAALFVATAACHGAILGAVRLRGLPFASCTEQDVLAFFAQNGIVECIVDCENAVSLGTRSQGRPSGHADVLMRSPWDAQVAQQALDGKWMGNRYIEVFVLLADFDGRWQVAATSMAKRGDAAPSMDSPGLGKDGRYIEAGIKRFGCTIWSVPYLQRRTRRRWRRAAAAGLLAWRLRRSAAGRRRLLRRSAAGRRRWPRRRTAHPRRRRQFNRPVAVGLLVGRGAARRCRRQSLGVVVGGNVRLLGEGGSRGGARRRLGGSQPGRAVRPVRLSRGPRARATRPRAAGLARACHP
ncbi:unnamed protein product [Prorocentrum cordatum]|uniref:RRM domain-containing protein n=1 Tax=Prorocentrum cordatum TaxID=2364126 RepID=A0ABN9W3D0_9DINO|nr:unnamed protein product [Polarella glacialis]